MKLSNRLPHKTTKIRQTFIKSNRQSQILIDDQKFSQSNSTVKYINNQAESGPVCPLKKQCFSKKGSRVISIHPNLSAQLLRNSPNVIKNIQMISSQKIRDNRMASSQRGKIMLSSYKYKPDKKIDNSMVNRSFSHSSFLRISRRKKQKLPKNILAMQSAIKGELDQSVTKSVYLQENH